MNEVKQAELTNALNAFQKAEKLSDEEMALMILEYAALLTRRLYAKALLKGE